MFQIIGLLVISWFLIWLFEKGNLSVLGLRPTRKRMKFALILFAVTAICCSTTIFMRMYFVQEGFSLNPHLKSSLILTGLWSNFNSVLFEELLCRGVALYILLKMLGEKWAVLISALIFGVLHWLINGVWGNGIQMAIVFSYTFVFGLVMAYAYTRSRSLYLPFAIHFGWNLTQNFVFPETLETDRLFTSVAQPVVTVSYLVYFTMILFPKLSAIIVDYLIVRSYKNELPQRQEGTKKKHKALV